MDSVEQLREALYDLNRQRDDDVAQLAQSQAVLAGLEKIAAASSPDAALDALLFSVRASTNCDAAVLLECVDAQTKAIASTDADLGDCSQVDPEFIGNRSLRIVDINAISEQAAELSCGGRYRSMISAPFEVSEGDTLVLVCLSRENAKLTRQHQEIAERLIALASQTLVTKRLADQNALLARVLDRSSASFSIADADDSECRLVYVNEAFETLTGYSRAEALGRNCRFLSAEDPDSKIRTDIRKTISDRSIGEFEVLNKRKSGELFWNNLSIFPVEAGGHSYIVATQWDLTSRVKAEADRDTARQQLVSALASVKEGILLLDPVNQVVFANDQFLAFHNLPYNALHRGVDFVEAWSAAKEKTGLSSDAAQASAISMLENLTQPCIQQEKTLGSGIQVLETNALTSVGGKVSVLNDVTALNVAQHQLSERVAAIDSVQDGIAITDVAGRIIYLNPGHVQMFGFRKSTELIGRKWSVLYHSDQTNFIEDVAIPEVTASGQWRGDVIGQRKDGAPIAHEVTLTKLAGAGLICVTRDITDRIQNEVERLSLREQINSAQRQEAIGQMAAGLAHDFNNCLSVMSGSAALVQDAKSDSERDQHAQRIIQAGEKAAELTSRLLQFGSRNSHRNVLDIREPIQSAIDLVRSSIGSKIELVLDLPRQPVICEIDPTDVLQVILNFVINARDAIGQGRGTIGVGLEKIAGSKLVSRNILGEINLDQDYAAVHVEDNGSGIAPDDLDTLFDAYVTTKSDQGGTGLGLSVVRSLVQANSGGIEVISKLKSGTRFSVYWPMGQKTSQSRKTDTAEFIDYDLRDVKVIVVDDDVQVAETIATFLEKAGCEVVICDEPTDAVLVVEDDSSYWDVVVTDYDMPEMTGAELAGKIRTIDEKLPIILCTALPEFMGGARLGANLFDARLSKPIDAKRLISEIGRTIGK